MMHSRLLRSLLMAAAFAAVVHSYTEQQIREELGDQAADHVMSLKAEAEQAQEEEFARLQKLHEDMVEQEAKLVAEKQVAERLEKEKETAEESARIAQTSEKISEVEEQLQAILEAEARKKQEQDQQHETEETGRIKAENDHIEAVEAELRTLKRVLEHQVEAKAAAKKSAAKQAAAQAAAQDAAVLATLKEANAANAVAQAVAVAAEAREAAAIAEAKEMAALKQASRDPADKAAYQAKEEAAIAAAEKAAHEKTASGKKTAIDFPSPEHEFPYHSDLGTKQSEEFKDMQPKLGDMTRKPISVPPMDNLDGSPLSQMLERVRQRINEVEQVKATKLGSEQ